MRTIAHNTVLIGLQHYQNLARLVITENVEPQLILVRQVNFWLQMLRLVQPAHLVVIIALAEHGRKKIATKVNYHVQQVMHILTQEINLLISVIKILARNNVLH